MKKATNLPRYKSGLGNQWRYVTSPGVWYFGGSLHYVNKQGRFVHAKPSEMKIDKSKIMTKSDFNKKFGHLLKNVEYMSTLRKLGVLI